MAWAVYVIPARSSRQKAVRRSVRIRVSLAGQPGLYVTAAKPAIETHLPLANAALKCAFFPLSARRHRAGWRRNRVKWRFHQRAIEGTRLLGLCDACAAGEHRDEDVVSQAEVVPERG